MYFDTKKIIYITNICAYIKVSQSDSLKLFQCIQKTVGNSIFILLCEIYRGL